MANPPLKIRWAVFIGIALLALAIRLPQLGARPMHTDESVNAYITGDLLAGGKFHYDPQDRHGPTLYALAEPVARLQGAKNFAELTEAELRLMKLLWARGYGATSTAAGTRGSDSATCTSAEMPAGIARRLTTWLTAGPRPSSSIAGGRSPSTSRRTSATARTRTPRGRCCTPPRW